MTPLPGVCRRCRAPVWWNGLFWMDVLQYNDMPKVFDNYIRGRPTFEGFPPHICAVQ